MAERLLVDMRLEEPRAYKKEFLQGFSGLPRQMGSSRQEHELLAGQNPSHGFSQPPELLLSHLVDNVEEVPDHVELVIDDLGLGTVRQKALPVRLPHIPDPMSDPMGPILPEPCPERLQVLLLAPLDDVQEFRAPGTFQGADQGPVGLPLPNPDLVEPQDGDPVPQGGDFKEQKALNE